MKVTNITGVNKFTRTMNIDGVNFNVSIAEGSGQSVKFYTEDNHWWNSESDNLNVQFLGQVNAIDIDWNQADLHGDGKTIIKSSGDLINAIRGAYNSVGNGDYVDGGGNAKFTKLNIGSSTSTYAEIDENGNACFQNLYITSGDITPGKVRLINASINLAGEGTFAKINFRNPANLGSVGTHGVDYNIDYTGNGVLKNLRLDNALNGGSKLNFGDGDHVYLSEDIDDRLKINADNGVEMYSANRSISITADDGYVNLSGESGVSLAAGNGNVEVNSYDDINIAASNSVDIGGQNGGVNINGRNVQIEGTYSGVGITGAGSIGIKSTKSDVNITANAYTNIKSTGDIKIESQSGDIYLNSSDCLYLNGYQGANIGGEYGKIELNTEAGFININKLDTDVKLINSEGALQITSNKANKGVIIKSGNLVLENGKVIEKTNDKIGGIITDGKIDLDGIATGKLDSVLSEAGIKDADLSWADYNAINMASSATLAREVQELKETVRKLSDVIKTLQK